MIQDSVDILHSSRAVYQRVVGWRYFVLSNDLYAINNKTGKVVLVDTDIYDS